MAEEVEEEPKKSNLLKIIIFVVAGLLLIVVGLGIGYLIFGGEPEPDPSAEVNQIIEGKYRIGLVVFQSNFFISYQIGFEHVQWLFRKNKIRAIRRFHISSFVPH